MKSKCKDASSLSCSQSSFPKSPPPPFAEQLFIVPLPQGMLGVSSRQ